MWLFTMWFWRSIEVAMLVLVVSRNSATNLQCLQCAHCSNRAVGVGGSFPIWHTGAPWSSPEMENCSSPDDSSHPGAGLLFASFPTTIAVSELKDGTMPGKDHVVRKGLNWIPIELVHQHTRGTPRVVAGILGPFICKTHGARIFPDQVYFGFTG